MRVARCESVSSHAAHPALEPPAERVPGPGTVADPASPPTISPRSDRVRRSDGLRPPAPSGIRIGTQNLLNANVGHARSFAPWPERARAFARWIDQMDVVATQEGVRPMIAELDALTPRHRWVGTARSDDPEVGELSAIFYDDDRFDLVDHGDFWLSETPERESIGWDAAMARIATWATLRDRDGETVTVLSTHFDHAGPRARLESARLIAQWVQERTSDEIVVAGDLNAVEGSAAHEALDAVLDDAARDASGTLHSAAPTYGERRIDYVFVEGRTSVRTYAVTQLCTEHGEPLSDHAAVIVELRAARHRGTSSRTANEALAPGGR